MFNFQSLHHEKAEIYRSQFNSKVFFRTKNKDQGWVVQKLVNFNPGLRENSRSNFFFKNRLTIL